MSIRVISFFLLKFKLENYISFKKIVIMKQLINSTKEYPAKFERIR